MSLRMVGPPYVPFFPVPVGDSQHIYVFVDSKQDSLHIPSDAPEFSLKSKERKRLVRPEWADTCEGGTGWRTYRYYFNLGGDPPDTLEVVFLKKYHGCDLPTVTFIATKHTDYESFVLPGN